MSIYVDRSWKQEPVVPATAPLDKPIAQKATEEPKERITSNTKVLLDGTGSEWSSLASGPSLAITTGSIASTQVSGVSKIRQTVNLALDRKGKLNKPDIAPLVIPEGVDERQNQYSVRASLRTRSEAPSVSTVTSLPDGSTIAPDDHVEDLLNQAIMSVDTVLEDIQQTSRKRPKNLLLGKIDFAYYGWYKTKIINTSLQAHTFLVQLEF